MTEAGPKPMMQAGSTVLWNNYCEDRADVLHDPSALREVVLWATGEDLDRLRGVVRQLGLVARRRDDMAPQRGVARQTGTDRAGPVAAFVSDRSTDPLGACRELSPLCPVVLISDETGFAFRLAAARAGASAVVRRPIATAELSEWLSLFSARAIQSPVSVLIIDDDRLVSTINAEVLQSAGMEVTTVSDPAEALKAVEDVSPDIVLMDLRMPGVDGIELAQVVRQSMQFASLPLIFLSAERDEERQLLARSLGGDDFIIKPIPPDKLVSLVRLRADRSRHLRSLIERDRLTGLLNHTRFKERLARELDRSKRTGAEVNLAIIDVDHFKRVNDEHGHSVGDEVLRVLADLLGTGLRRTDLVGRCGGEEFGVILLDTTADHAVRVIDTLRQRFRETQFQGAHAPFTITFSAGLASSSDFGGVTDLSAAADAALYGAKQAGRNLVRVGRRH